MLFDRMKKHMILTSLVMTFVVAFVLTLYRLIVSADVREEGTEFIRAFPVILITWMFFIYPVVMTGLNVFFIFTDKSDLKYRRSGRIMEVSTLVLGTVFTWLYIPFSDIQFRTDFGESLYRNSQVHTPVFTEAHPTILVLTCVGVMGYLVLSLVKLNRMSPLAVVFSMAAMYIGIMLSSLWVIQLSTLYQPREGAFSFAVFFFQNVLFSLLPLNCLLIALKVIREKMEAWNGIEHQQKEYKNKLLLLLQYKLMKSENWPVLAFILMWPLLGLIIGILAFFGQSPDSIIKAWTETSDWTFSQKLPPT